MKTLLIAAVCAVVMATGVQAQDRYSRKGMFTGGGAGGQAVKLPFTTLTAAGKTYHSVGFVQYRGDTIYFRHTPLATQTGGEAPRPKFVEVKMSDLPANVRQSILSQVPAERAAPSREKKEGDKLPFEGCMVRLVTGTNYNFTAATKWRLTCRRIGRELFAADGNYAIVSEAEQFKTHRDLLRCGKVLQVLEGSLLVSNQDTTYMLLNYDAPVVDGEWIDTLGVAVGRTNYVDVTGATRTVRLVDHGRCEK